MKSLAVVLLLVSCSPPPPPAPPEPVEEKPFAPGCTPQPRVGMTHAELFEACKGSSDAVTVYSVYAPDWPRAVALRWCRRDSPCHQMWIAVFWDGELQTWGRAYEVQQ